MSKSMQWELLTAFQKSSSECAMKPIIEFALDCIRRGWYVFPCVPKTKVPLGGLVPRGFKDASNDEVTIRRWWQAVELYSTCRRRGFTALNL